MILTYPSARIRIRAVLTAFFVLAHPVTAQFEVTEATIAELQEAMDTGLSLIHISEPTRPY